jgi:polysaccharide export outer membrane protein
VQRPGDFPLTGPITVLQGLALAGGFREFAKTENIQIIRREGNGQRFIPVNYKRLEGGRDASQNLVLSPGDTIVVP